MHRTSASVADLPRATDAYLGAGADDLHMAGGRSSPFAGPPTMLYRPSQTAGGGQRRSVPEQFIVDEEGMRDEIRALARRMEAVEHEKAELRGRIARAERELQRRDRQIEDLLEARTPTGAQEGGPRQSGGTAPLRVETSLARSLRDRVRLLEVRGARRLLPRGRLPTRAAAGGGGDKEAEIFRVKNSAEYRAAAEGERLRTRQRGAAEALADLQERALHLRARRSLAEAGEELQRLREALRARQREAAAAEAAAQQSQRDRAARLAGLEERLAARGAAVARLQEERDRLERLLRLEEGAVGRHAAEAARGQRAVDGLQRRISELSG
eukprot:tig00020603_g11757.t1